MERGKQKANETENKKIRIAIADDHALVRESVSTRIEDDGDIEVVIQAADGKELITSIEKSKIKPDVCLIDIMMPVLDGFQTVEHLKKLWPEIKLLVLTGYLRETYVVQMILAGANGYLSKNSHPHTVKEAIRHVTEFDIYCNEQFCLKDIKAIRDGHMELPNLTEKEKQLLRYCIEDLTYGEIADKMATSSKSVEGYRNKLFEKLGVKTRAGLTMYAVRYGYAPIDTGVLPGK
ncbi:MAG: hypothetical protein BGO69_05450 [Bacteroidetes bacterium 46-16]|nr:MAG: hypothetical protein BGO69_05450 [Bacteroidetes bacterium 46-16]